MINSKNTLFLGILFLLVSCKAGNSNNTDAQLQQNKPVEKDKMLALTCMNDNPKINPNEAIVSVEVLSKIENEKSIEYLVILNKQEKTNFGFNAFMKVGEKYTLVSSNKNLNIQKGMKLLCVIEEIMSMSSHQKFRLIKTL